jgi:hypothetical protein
VCRPSRDFGSRNASIPKSPYSRPMPDCLKRQRVPSARGPDQRVGCLDGQRTRTQAFQINHHRVGALAGGVAGAGLTTP